MARAQPGLEQEAAKRSRQHVRQDLTGQALVDQGIDVVGRRSLAGSKQPAERVTEDRSPPSPGLP
jgi:hypothetical protein